MPDKRPYSRQELLRFTTSSLSNLNAQRQRALRQRKEQIMRANESQRQLAEQQEVPEE